MLSQLSYAPGTASSVLRTSATWFIIHTKVYFVKHFLRNFFKYFVRPNTGVYPAFSFNFKHFPLPQHLSAAVGKNLQRINQAMNIGRSKLVDGIAELAGHGKCLTLLCNLHQFLLAQAD